MSFAELRKIIPAENDVAALYVSGSLAYGTNAEDSDIDYRGKTSIVITTDHGRGTSPMTEWKSHGTIYQGSDEIWAAARAVKADKLIETQTIIRFRKILEAFGYAIKATEVTAVRYR